jgi:ATP-binding cassette subfamily B protein
MAATLRRTLAELKGQRGLLVAALAVSCAATGLALTVPLLLGDGIDTMLAAGSVQWDKLAQLITLLVVIVAATAVLQWVQGVLTQRLSVQTVARLRRQAFAHIEALPARTLDTMRTGDLMARITQDAELVGDGLLQGLTQVLSGIVTIVGTLAVMLAMSVPIALAVILLTPLAAAVAWGIARATQHTFGEQQELLGAMSTVCEEAFGALELEQAFGQERAQEARMEATLQPLDAVGRRAQFAGSLTNPTTRLVNNLVYAAVCVLGCVSALGLFGGLAGALSIGQIQAFLGYATQYAKPFNDITGVFAQVQTALAGAERLFALLDTPAEEPVLALYQDAAPAPAHAVTAEKDREVDGSTSPHFSADAAEGLGAPVAAALPITFDNVCFSYVAGQEVLHNVSFTVPAGTRLAVVGHTGSGKSTLINLLLRFYEPDAGRILVGDAALAGQDRAATRRQFGMVLQDSWLFEGTLRENICFAKPGASEAEVARVCAATHLDVLAAGLEQGLDTWITPETCPLSEGQRQLVAIARVMLQDPPMLILDEATSQLDARTEAYVTQACLALMEGRTSIVVAHRLSTIRDAQQIVVLDAGRVRELGSHEELLAASGAYAELYQSQLASTAEELEELS